VYVIACYSLDDSLPGELRRALPNVDLRVWPPRVPSIERQSVFAEKVSFLTFASSVVVDLRPARTSGKHVVPGVGSESFEPLSYLFGALVRLLDGRIDCLAVLGLSNLEQMPTVGAHEGARLATVIESGALEGFADLETFLSEGSLIASLRDR
jgi:hypothetical protein